MFNRIFILTFLLIFSQSSWSEDISESCGKEWQWSYPLPHGIEFTDIIWIPEQQQFVALAYNSLMTSPDGVNWQLSKIALDDISAIAWNGQKLVAIGGYYQMAVATSKDGNSWQQHPATNFEVPILSSTYPYQEDIMSSLINDMVWGDKQFIAVGYKGQIINSTDGITWTQQTSATNLRLNGIAYNGNIFVSVGDNGKIISSKDGINWQQQSSTKSNNLYSIMYNGNQFLVTGESGLILTSTDGINWHAANAGTNNIFEEVIWTGNKYIAIGKESKHSSGIIYSSQNGTSWSDQTPTEQKLSFIRNIAYNGSKMVALMRSHTISSDDGIKWLLPDEENTHFTDHHAIATNATETIIVGGNGSIFTSTDEKNWQYFSSFNDYNTSYNDVYWNGNQFLIAGDNGRLLSSSNRSNWQLESSGTQSNLNSIAWNEQTYVVVGDNGTVITSNTGINWVNQSSGISVQLNDILWTGTYFMAVGQNGIIIFSTDGENWQQINSGTTINLNAITYNGQQYVAVGENESIFMSNDATLWRQQFTQEGQNILYDVVWANNQFYAVGQSSLVFTSPNGITWTREHALPSSIHSKTIHWNNKRLLVAGFNGAVLSSSCYQNLNHKNTRVIIVAGGGDTTDPLWTATNMNANKAYRTLRLRGINRENIRYFNAVTSQDVDGDGNAANDIYAAPSSALLDDAIKNWAGSQVNSSTPLLVYLIDHGGPKRFYISKPKNTQADILTSTTLANWLNDLQEKTSARTTLIYDACNSGSFMEDLKVPDGKNYERINIFSSKADQVAYFGSQGQISFSSFFWGNTSYGYDVRQAFRKTQVALRSTTQSGNQNYQSAILDDNGDGLYDSHSDGSLASDTQLGIDAITAAAFPEIITGSTLGSTTISTNEEFFLYAKVDLPPQFINKVWVVAVPPKSNSIGDTPVINLPMAELSFNSASDRYESNKYKIGQTGQYTLSYFIEDDQGNISPNPKIEYLIVTSTVTTEKPTTILEQSNTIFDWAEINYAQYFTPPNQETWQVFEYLARYYPQTKTWLGAKDGHVYVYNEELKLLDAGKINDFMTLINNK
ncbi:MAG: C13 family peptidase [Pseudomonadota bacterium]